MNPYKKNTMKKILTITIGLLCLNLFSQQTPSYSHGDNHVFGNLKVNNLNGYTDLDSSLIPVLFGDTANYELWRVRDKITFSDGTEQNTAYGEVDNKITGDSTVYVSKHLGNDVTGTGELLLPYATIEKASDHLVGSLIDGGYLTIQLDSGNYPLTAQAKTNFETITLLTSTSYFKIKGSSDTLYIAPTLTATADPFTYDVLIGGAPPVWSADSVKNCFLKEPSDVNYNYFPIYGSTVSTLSSMTDLENDLYLLKPNTILDLEDDGERSSITMAGITSSGNTSNFYYELLNFTCTSNTFKQFNAVSYFGCNINYSTSMTFRHEASNIVFDGCNINGTMALRAGSVDASLLFTYFYGSNTTGIVRCANSGFVTFRGLVIEGINHTEPAIQVKNISCINNNATASNAESKIINCIYGVSIINGEFSAGPDGFYLDNTDYYIEVDAAPVTATISVAPSTPNVDYIFGAEYPIDLAQGIQISIEGLSGVQGKIYASDIEFEDGSILSTADTLKPLEVVFPAGVVIDGDGVYVPSGSSYNFGDTEYGNGVNVSKTSTSTSSEMYGGYDDGSADAGISVLPEVINIAVASNVGDMNTTNIKIDTTGIYYSDDESLPSTYTDRHLLPKGYADTAYGGGSIPAGNEGDVVLSDGAGGAVIDSNFNYIEVIGGGSTGSKLSLLGGDQAIHSTNSVMGYAQLQISNARSFTSNTTRVDLYSSDQAGSSEITSTIVDDGTIYESILDVNGIRLNNYNPANWTDDYLIPKGFADTAYTSLSDGILEKDGNTLNPHPSYKANSLFYGSERPVNTTRLSWDGAIAANNFRSLNSTWGSSTYMLTDPISFKLYYLGYERVRLFPLDQPNSVPFYYESISERDPGVSIMELVDAGATHYKFLSDSLYAEGVHASFDKVTASYGNIGSYIKEVDAISDTTNRTNYYLNVTYTTTDTVLIVLEDDFKVSGNNLFIKDAGGNASTNKIRIAPESGTIDGAASVIINSNYGAIEIYSDDSNWFIKNILP